MLPQNHGRKHDTLPRRNPNEGALALWDPGGRLPGDEIIESKRAGKASKSKRNGVARQNEKPGRLKNQSDSSTFHDKSTTHLLPSITVPSCRRKVHQLFVLRPIERALRRPGRCQGNNANKALQRRRLVAVTPESRAVTPIPAPCTHSSSL